MILHDEYAPVNQGEAVPGLLELALRHNYWNYRNTPVNTTHLDHAAARLMHEATRAGRAGGTTGKWGPLPEKNQPSVSLQLKTVA